MGSIAVKPPFYFTTPKESGHVTTDMPTFTTLEEAQSKRHISEFIYYAFFDIQEQKYMAFTMMKPFSNSIV